MGAERSGVAAARCAAGWSTPAALFAVEVGRDAG